MIELSLLGPHAVRGSDGRELGSLPAQPKRFALLAYLAVSTASGGYERRDTLAAMFWPDLDQFAARRALRNTLYHLRDALGDDALVTRGDDAVAIDPARVMCDVTKLSAAVADGRYEEAVHSYRGELLTGVHFAKAGEAFEEWLSRERARVSDLVMRALRALVDRQEQAGDPAGAAYWAQRACALAPGDEGWVRRAMMLLDDAHDRGGALRLYDTQAQRLAAEFDATPSAETVELARMIRKGREQRVANRERVAPGNGEPLAATAVSVAASPASALPATSPLAAPPAAPPSSGGTVAGARRRVAWATALSAGVVGLALVAWIAKPTHARTARKDRVVIAVFENRTGDTKYQALGRMAEDWLAQGLLRAQIVDVVDPRAVDAQGRSSGGGTVDPVTLARRTNSAMVVSGSYYRTGDSLLLEAAVTDAHAGKIVRVIGPIVARADNPVAALNDLRSRVMTALASVINIHFPADFDVAGDVPPYDAYEAYVEGWDAFWHSDGRKAEQLFLRAAQLDPTFAGAAVGLSIAAGNSGDCTLVDSVAHALAGRPEALSRFDRLSVQIGVARCHGRNDELLRLTLERAALEPRTSGLRGPAAAAALLANRPQQAVTLLESIDPSTDLVVGTDSTHVAYWGGLTEGLHLLGRHDQELTAADRASPAAPLSRAWMRARALAPMHRPAQVLLLVETMMTLPVETQNDIGLAPFTEGRPQYNQTPGWLIVWISRELAVHGDVWTSRQAASRALAWYESRSAEDRATPEERLGVAWSLELLGRYAKADTVIRALIAEDTANVDYKGILAGLAAEQGDTPLADSLDAWLATQSVDRVAFSANFYRARVAALLGRDDTAVARVRDELDEGAWPMLLHVEPTFEHLRARPDFVALMAPKG